MRRSKCSKPVYGSGHVLRCTLLVACAVLPLVACTLAGGGSDSAPATPDMNAAGAPQVVAAAGASPTTSQAGSVALNVMPTEAAGSIGFAGAAGAAPYLLPADFKKTEMGGYKLGPALDPNAPAGAAGASSADLGSTCGTQILAVVRDFKEFGEQGGGHPDFGVYKGSSPSLGIVKATLGADQKPEYNGTGPITDAKNGQQTTSKVDFDEWYRATPNINAPYLLYLYFEPNQGVLTFQSDTFFPLDGTQKNRFGLHDSGFTTEVHTEFSYKGGETFTFTGDDDLWVFINRHLAIDLGGLHSKQTKTVSLDTDAAKLELSVGNSYHLDLFHAERHAPDSTFRIDTNLAFTNCGVVIEEPPVK